MLLWYCYTVYDRAICLGPDKDIVMEMSGMSRNVIIAQLVMYAIVSITILVLLIGLLSDRVPLMKPFNIIYLIFIILSLVDDVYSFIKVHNLMNNFTLEDINKYYEAMGKNTNNLDFSNIISESQFKEILNQIFLLAVATTVIGLIIDIIYYITTRNYIKFVENEEKDVDNIRKMESAN